MSTIEESLARFRRRQIQILIGSVGLLAAIIYLAHDLNQGYQAMDVVLAIWAAATASLLTVTALAIVLLEGLLQVRLTVVVSDHAASTWLSVA